MADKIKVTVAPTAFTLAAGETAEAIATLRNQGQSVDQLTLSVEGLDPKWYTLPVSSVALFPNDQDNLKVILHPPKTDEVKAGSYSFHIKVASRETPSEGTMAPLTLTVPALPGVELDISPERIAGRKGVYQLIFDNRGDSEVKLALKASDAQGRLRYRLQPAGLTVSPRSKAEVSLLVRLSWLAFLGGERQFDFQVMATPSGAGGVVGQPRTLNGQFVRIPWYRALPQIPWLARPPVITSFRSSTEDKREFKLTWSARRATDVQLDGENVDAQGERVVRPSEPRKYVLTAVNKHGNVSQTVEVQPLPLPKGEISERIRVSLSPAEVQVTAGGVPVLAWVTVQNVGGIVDKFNLTIDGIDEAWYSRTASTVALLPQATEQVQISFLPPKKKGVRAGKYPFAVKVVSQSAPNEFTSLVGQLEVLPVAEFQVKVHPTRITARTKGTYRVNLANTGVSNIGFALGATDLDEGCRFYFKTENPTLGAWNSMEVPMIARPKRGSMVGERKRFDITVTATAAGGSAQSASCELNHHPFIASWKTVLRFVRTIIFLGIIVVGLYFLFQLGGGFGQLLKSPQTWLAQFIGKIEAWFRR